MGTSRRLRQLNRNRPQPVVFPYSPIGAPSHIICNDCGGNGWGPMLTTRAWESITADHEEERERRDFFLCEECMTDRKGMPLHSDELRDCPGNFAHPLYKAHGRY